LAAFVVAGLVMPASGSGQVRTLDTPTDARAEVTPSMSSTERLAPWAGTPALFPFPPPRAQVTAPAAPVPVPIVQARARNRRGVPLMVAGGILFVAGAIAGDDVGTILMLGGAGIGAWGAYVYFGGE
jgi:hypothetical protein